MSTSHASAPRSFSAKVGIDDLRSFLAIFDGLRTKERRARVWGERQAMVTLMTLCEPGTSRSYRDACELTHATLGQALGWKRVPAASGLVSVRQKLGKSKPSKGVLKRIWSAAMTWADARLARVPEALPGWRLIAVDGMGMIMPRSASCSAAYQIRRDKSDNELSHYPEARLVSAWDVERRLPLAWKTSSAQAKGGERRQTVDLLSELPERSMLLCDRGLPSREMFAEILAEGHGFVMRMPAGGTWPEIKQFIASNADDAIVQVRLGKPASSPTTPLRLVRRSFDRGRPQSGQSRDRMVILATLTDPLITAEQIIALYQKRWTIETIHNELKTHIGIEDWHSTTKAGIDQEILVRMLWHLLIGHISSHLEADAIAKDPASTKRANTKRVMSSIARAVTYIFDAAAENGTVRTWLLARARAAIESAQRQMVNRRHRKSKPRIALHPYARPR